MQWILPKQKKMRVRLQAPPTTRMRNCGVGEVNNNNKLFIMIKAQINFLSITGIVSIFFFLRIMGQFCWILCTMYYALHRSCTQASTLVINLQVYS